MADLYFGLAILIVLAITGFWMAVRITHRGPGYRCDLLAFEMVLLMGLYIVHLWNQTLLARVLPYSNLVVLGNWFLPFGGFMAGLVWRRIQGHPFRRLAVTAALPVIGFYSAIHPLLGSEPRCEERWQDDVCLQTAPTTCSPASAATLLRVYGITTTEQEMAKLCLTREGTSWAGIYRGLKTKTRGTDWDVEWFECDLQSLRAQVLRDHRPVLLSVGISEETSKTGEYQSDWGLTPGQPHTVVLFNGLGSSACVIGDPAIGRELWAWHDLSKLWQGQGIRLVRRHNTNAVAIAHKFE